MALSCNRGKLKMKRQKAGKTRSLHSSGKGSRLADIQSRPPACATHDFSDVIGWNRKG